MSMIRIGSLGVILIYTMVGYNVSICIIESESESLKKEIQHQHSLTNGMEKKVNLYRCMSRTCWEHWQWELQQRRQLIIHEKIAINRN